MNQVEEGTNAAILEVDGVYKSFGGVMAVNDVTFAVQPGEILGVIGPNGAGKTTLFNLISGLLSLSVGEIRLRGRRLNGLKPHDIAALGIARTFQTVRIFHNMTVLENVMVGRHLRSSYGVLAAAFRLARGRLEEQEIRQRAEELLELVGLAARADDNAANLPLGQQRLLEIGRALACEPQVLLLDEPASGLNLPERQELAQLIYRIRDSGVTVLLVEHDMGLVMGIVDRVIVLDYGAVIAQGSPEEVQANPQVIAAYLGEEEI